MAVYAFDAAIDLEITLAVEYEGARDMSWEGILTQARAGAGPGSRSHQKSAALATAAGQVSRTLRLESRRRAESEARRKRYCSSSPNFLILR